jgi:hypothetical protein
MYGFVEQLLHYFNRPHTGVPAAPLDGPAAWRGADLARSNEWHEELSEEHVAELNQAVASAMRCGKPTQELTPAEFPLPLMRHAIDRWREELSSGRGFLLVSGFPVQHWSPPQAETAFWGLGLHLGIPGAQNLEGDLLGHVIDLGASARHADERLYRTNKNIRFHCDAADAVGLMCLATAPSGGASRLVSSVTVFNHLLRSRPDLARRLFEPFLLDARQPPQAATQYTQVQPCAFDGTRLRTFMHCDYFTSVERLEGITLDPAAREVIAEWEAYAERPDVHLDMQLGPGDVQLVSNHTVVHARTSYVDAPGSPRHLLRLWLSLEAGAASLHAP